VLFQSLDL